MGTTLMVLSGENLGCAEVTRFESQRVRALAGLGVLGVSESCLREKAHQPVVALLCSLQQAPTPLS